MEHRLKHAVKSYILKEKAIFLNGGMSGFDVIAGKTVLHLKDEYPEILCVTAAPFRIGFFNNQNWTPEWKARALDLYKKSDIAFCLSETYHKRVYYERDEYMVNHSNSIICFYEGKGRGTKYTLNYAIKRGLNICNIALISKLIV